MLRPLLMLLSLSLSSGLAAQAANADPPRILGSHIREHADVRGDSERVDRGRDGREQWDGRGRDGREQGDSRGRDGREQWDGRGRDDQWHARGGDRDDRRGDRDDRRGDRDGWRDGRHDHDRWRGQHQNRDGYRDRDRYSFGLFLGSPWYGAPSYYDDYPRYRDRCRIVYQTRYDRWGRAYRERVRECYDRGRGWSPWNGW